MRQLNGERPSTKHNYHTTLNAFNLQERGIYEATSAIFQENGQENYKAWTPFTTTRSGKEKKTNKHTNRINRHTLEQCIRIIWCLLFA